MTQIIGCTDIGTVAQSQARITDEAPYIATLNAGQVLDKISIYSEAGSGTGTFDLAIYRAQNDLGLAPLLFLKTGVSFNVPGAEGWVDITGLGDDLSSLAGETITVTCNNLSGFTGREVNGAISASTNGRRNGSATELNDPFGGFSTTNLNSVYITTADAVTYTASIPQITFEDQGSPVQASDIEMSATLDGDDSEVLPETTVASDASGVVGAQNVESGSSGDAIWITARSKTAGKGWYFKTTLEAAI